MPLPETFVEMNFPCGGIDQSDAFSEQKPREILKGLYSRTTPSAENVRGYALGERLRGGSRPMLARYILNPPVAGWIIQCLDAIVGTGYDQPAAGPSDVGLTYNADALLYNLEGIVFGESP